MSQDLARSSDRNARLFVSRRDWIARLGYAGVAALVAGSGAGRAFAQDAAAPATPESLQGAGFFRFTQGGITYTQVSDGGIVMNPSQLFVNADKDELAKLAKEVHISPDGFPGQIGCLVVEHGSDKLLIDTGAGKNFGPTAGYLTRNLKTAGLKPTDITHVLITHAHPDHIGGLLTPDGKLAFPNARVFVNRAEHDFWTNSPDLSQMAVPDEMKKTVIGAAQGALAGAKDRLELVKPDDVIAGVATVVDAPGHTPGHIAYKLGVADAKAEDVIFDLGDALHVLPLQLKRPDWHPAFDADAVAASATRKKLLDRVADESALTTGKHLPFPSVGYVDHDGTAYRWTAKVWTW